MPRIQYQDVASSNIRALGFERGIGYVEFGGGRRFAYKMTKALFEEMKTAKSIGSFFARNVKSLCPVVWQGYCCDNSPCKSDAAKIGHPANDPKAGTFRVCDPCTSLPRFADITFQPVPEDKKP